MFRTNNCSSSGGVLYKQLTVFHHAEIVSKWYEFSRYGLTSYTAIKSIEVFGSWCRVTSIFLKRHYIERISENALASCNVLKCCECHLKESSRWYYAIDTGSRQWQCMNLICNLTIHLKGKGHPCTGTEALYRPYGP